MGYDRSVVAPDPVRVYERAAPCVVKVQGERKIGTGFLIQYFALYFILTCAHVLEPIDNFTAEFLNGFSLRATCTFVSRKMDLAVLSPIIDENIPELHILEIESSQLQQGKRCWILGSPYGMEGAFTRADILQAPLGDFIRFKALIAPGFSGSPLIDAESGAVVGMVTGAAGTSLGFAIPIEPIRSELSFFADNLTRVQQSR
jgi:S1-C subfamily serine protease